MFSVTHTDTDTAGTSKIRGQIMVVDSDPEWNQLRFDVFGHGTDAVLGTLNESDPAWVNLADKAVAAVPFEIYLSFGSERESFTPA
ncbi:hypothetical protein LCGC14_2927010 [marine sediment metagenome]|uniref:Uncharacterized protein n=1 Tax=marine sediment metagenome TaxID=412755 RepID=A0A0F8Y8W8_9ZZZZ